MTNWIRVEDRLPEWDEKVLIIQINISDTIYTGSLKSMTKTAKRESTWWQLPGFGLSEAKIISDVTHWQPLPEPPTI